MIKKLKQQIRGYQMPEYLIEILTRNYCRTFLPMTIIRQGESYTMTYDTGRFDRMELNSLSQKDRIQLLLFLLEMNERNEDHLIPADRYLIEPELIYRSGRGIAEESVRLLFYPDLKSHGFRQKLRLFTDKINTGTPEEKEPLVRFTELLAEEEDLRAERHLERALAKYWDG